jgi:hypothetical protein
MNEMAKNVNLVLQRMVGLEKAWENHQRDTKPLSRAEIELMIEKAQEKKNGGGARLTKEEIKDIVTEVLGARPSNGWPSWKYILLGAVITSPGLVLEAAKVFLR